MSGHLLRLAGACFVIGFEKGGTSGISYHSYSREGMDDGAAKPALVEYLIDSKAGVHFDGSSEYLRIVNFRAKKTSAMDTTS